MHQNHDWQPDLVNLRQPLFGDDRGWGQQVIGHLVQLIAAVSLQQSIDGTTHKLAP
jgi:hypothetical protein